MPGFVDELRRRHVLIIALLVLALGVSIGFNVTGIRNGAGETTLLSDRSSIAVLPLSM